MYRFVRGRNSMDKESKEALSTFHQFVSSTALFFFAVVINGMGMMFMWGWFVVPLGVAPIGLAHSVGLAGMVRFLCMGVSKKKNDDPVAVVAMQSVAMTVIVTGFGWIASMCM